MNLDMPFPLVGRAPRAARFDGKRRFAVNVSSDPLGIRPPALAKFLGKHAEPLSLKAAQGFLSRTRRARLRFDAAFIDAVERHVERLGGHIPPRQARECEEPVSL